MYKTDYILKFEKNRIILNINHIISGDNNHNNISVPNSDIINSYI